MIEDQRVPSLFQSNPRRAALAITDRELARLCEDAAARFVELPLHHRGESTETRRTEVPFMLAQRFVPSLNSMSRGRKGTLEGTETLRQQISRIFWERLHSHRIATCHLAWKDGTVLVTEERVPPIEVVVKAALVGTPARVYHGILGRGDRFGRPFEANQPHAPYVRFDYRNPLQTEAGTPLRDECLPLALADRFIDVERASERALATFEIVRGMLRGLDLDALDACFLFDETGSVLCSEVSPDNMRVKRVGWTERREAADSFDKDLWRGGEGGELIIAQWTALRDWLEERYG
jgi:phosphoribosylaminoimidazole-succinocarboxamide synthase